MPDNISFISANDLPTIEAESVEVLCIDNGELKKMTMAENINFISADELSETEAESVEVLCIENGELKKKAADGLGGGGDNVFIIDTTADDYDTSDTAYGDKVKDAILSGKTVYYFNDSKYGTVGSFYIYSSTTGDQFLALQISTFEYMAGNTTYSSVHLAISAI